MILTLVVTKNCNCCERAEEQLKQFVLSKENLKLIITNINDFNRRGIAIVPALIINDELFSYGDVNVKKLELKFTA